LPKTLKYRRRSYLSLAILVIITIAFFALPPINLSETISFSIKPVNLYLYLRINKISIVYNTPIGGKIQRVAVTLIVQVEGTNQTILNKTILEVDLIQGIHDIGKEFIFDIPDNTSWRYTLRFVDNYTKTPVPAGLPAKYNTSLFTTNTRTFPISYNVSYAVVGKDVIASASEPLTLYLRYLDKELAEKTASRKVYHKTTILTDYYVRIYVQGEKRSFILVYYVDGKGRVFFRSADNIFIIILTDTLLLFYSWLTLHRYRGKSSSSRKTRRKKKRR